MIRMGSNPTIAIAIRNVEVGNPTFDIDPTALLARYSIFFIIAYNNC